MFNCGTFYIDGGYRPCISKTGHKWSNLIYLDGRKVRCRRVRKQKVGKVKPLNGRKPYTIQQLARAFLRPKTSFGSQRKISKRTKAILREVIDRGIVI